MILSQSINIKSCVVCSVYQSTNEITTYFNDNLGHYHKYIYLIDGVLDTYPTVDGNITGDTECVTLEADNLYDISSSKGKYIVSKTKDVSSTMIKFNPIPMDINIAVEIVKDKQTSKLKATERTSIVCLTGPIEINGKTINTMQFATLPLNKTVTLNMQDGAICAIVTG